MPESDVTKMKVADLKRELKLRGLATTGNKTELQDRLQTSLLDGDISLEDSAMTNEDALLDEDAVLTDEEQSPIGADENELLKSPSATPTASELVSPLNDKTPVGDITKTKSASNPKQIMLKRKCSFTSERDTGAVATDNTTSSLSKENTEPAKEKILKMSERNPITMGDAKSKENTNSTSTNGALATDFSASGKKMMQLSQMERLELRAKKFGLGTNPSNKSSIKLNNTKVVKNDGGALVNDAKQIEMLKKRAERFGCVVSSKMAQIDAAEKLQKRKERFGVGSTAAKGGSDGAATKSNIVWAEKARARLERFKNTATMPTTGAKGIAASTESTDIKAEPSAAAVIIAAPPNSIAGN